MSSVRPHVPEEELHAFHDGELSSAQRAEIAEHLLGCLLCRALDGEVQEVRSRATALLNRAIPRTVHRPATRRRVVATWRGPIAAGLVALVGGATWLTFQPAPKHTPQLATAFTTPGLFADLRSMRAPAAPDATTLRLTMVAHTRVAPRVMALAIAPAARAALDAKPVDDIDPAGGGDWEAMGLDGAVEASHGAIARLDGLPVAKVQIRRSASGERPTILVRQKTSDGHSVWVVEGPVDELASLSEMFQASGLTMSMPLRTRPDYVGSDANPIRTERMVAVAAYLPVDSLDALSGKLKRN